jgi:hypothetical protein
MRYLALLALGVLGCAPPHLELRGFATYVHHFEDAWGHKVEELDVDFDLTLKDNTVAYCRIGTWPQVRINRHYWGIYNETVRTIVMFHELGHCILERPHSDARLPDGCPLSIMYPFVLGTRCWQAHAAHYTAELFQ